MKLKTGYVSMLAFSTKGEKIIKNANIPACMNCIYYKPTTMDFTYSLSRCEKFGEKDIVTDKITYDFADSCRNNESKCGLEGKYFEEEPNIALKIAKHFILKQMPYICIFILPFLSFILSTRSN